MTTRPFLSSHNVAPAAAETMKTFHADVVERVSKAITLHKVVVVGMGQNPFVKRARKALTGAGIGYEYISYGSYLSGWKERLAVKLWSGYPTFPQVFVDGTLIGGAVDTEKAIAAGTLKA